MNYYVYKTYRVVTPKKNDDDPDDGSNAKLASAAIIGAIAGAIFGGLLGALVGTGIGAAIAAVTQEQNK